MSAEGLTRLGFASPDQKGVSPAATERVQGSWALHGVLLGNQTLRETKNL